MSSCAACGAEDQERRFCGQCGARIAEDPSTISLSAIGVRPALGRRWLLALGVLAGAAICALAWWAMREDETPSTIAPPELADAGLPRIRIGIPRPRIVDASSEDAALDAGTGLPDASPRRAPSQSRGPRPTTRPPTTRPPTIRPPATRPPTTSAEPSRTLGASEYLSAARRHVAHTYRAGVQQCFSVAQGQTHGTVIMAMWPTHDGRVASSRIISDTTNDPRIGACLVRTARTWTLPPPPPRTLEVQLRYTI